MITLYDLAAKEPIKTWSLNVWKTRFVLNLKKLPYKTVYLEYPDLKIVLKQAGVPFTVKRDGSHRYTAPSIVDDATGAAISDSFKIAEYLDNQYPDTPKAFPSGSLALQAAFNALFVQMTIHLAALMVPKTPGILNPISAEYYNQMDVIGPAKPPEIPEGEELEQLWSKAKVVFDTLDGFYAKSDGPYIMGETPSFADFILGGVFEEMKVLEDWDRIVGLNGGRWERLVMGLGKYASTEN